MQVLIFVNNVN